MAERDLVRVTRLVDQIRQAIAREDRAALCENIAQLVVLRAPMGEQWEQLAALAARIGEIGLARKAADLLVEATGGSAAGQYRKAALLFDIGLSHEADALLRSIPAHLPDPVANAYSRAAAALNLGNPAEARLCVDEVLRARPQLGSAWLLLSQTADLARDAAAGDRIVAAGPHMAGMPPAERALYLYALGKAHADRGAHEAAFDAYARGARDMKSLVRFDRAADHAQAAQAVRGHDAQKVAALAAVQSEPTDRTIFVVGLPRSGTTLVEQILTSHSAVSEGAEVNLLSLLAREAGGPALSALARYVEGGGAASAARLWRHWLGERFPAPGRVINKAMDSSRFLGVAAALLPQAPLIWITRDPLDRAWSCFRTSFLGGALPWSYDLEDIAAHFRVEDALLAQWREILGDRLFVLSYEALVSEPEHWIGKLLAHCGLAEEPQVFAPHENQRPVATASWVQVRRPIDRAGIGAAAPYRAWLEPFVRAYCD